MIVALDMELVDLASFRRRASDDPGLVDDALTDDERAWCERQADPTRSAAARLAAKTAVLRSLGLDPRAEGALREVRVARDASGRPGAILSGRAERAAAEAGVRRVHVSLTHARDHAAAAVVLED